MTAKEFLNQAYRMNIKIEESINELEQLRYLSMSLPKMDLTKDVIKSSKNPCAKYTEIMEKILELENQIANYNDDYIDFKIKIHSVICQLENSDERIVLFSRYVRFEGWEQIANKINRSKSRTFEIHNNALKHIKELLNDL